VRGGGGALTDKRLVHVRNIMTDRFDLFDRTLTVADAFSRLRYPDAGAIVITGQSEGDLYGIVLREKMADQATVTGRSPDAIRLFAIAENQTLHVAGDMPVRGCVRAMQQAGLSFAPVVENDVVIGLVSYRELVVQTLVSTIKLF
jgi:CBS domain-containing protein